MICSCEIFIIVYGDAFDGQMDVDERGHEYALVALLVMISPTFEIEEATKTSAIFLCR